MEESIRSMAQAIDAVLDHGLHSLWLYGSVVLNDFRPGWSDIDFIAFSQDPIAEKQAEQLLTLRQDLSARSMENPYYRCFEGVILDRQAYKTGRYVRLVYWGTTGQRIVDRFELDAFSQLELAKYGLIAYGKREEGLFREPSRDSLIAAVRRHYESIRQWAVQTDERLYSCGWLLDISRCLYTLRNNDVIGKTQAGHWALDEHLFSDEAPLQKTLLIRRDPLSYRDRNDVQAWLRSLGPTVQQYADVLERELEKRI